MYLMILIPHLESVVSNEIQISEKLKILLVVLKPKRLLLHFSTSQKQCRELFSEVMFDTLKLWLVRNATQTTISTPF